MGDATESVVAQIVAMHPELVRAWTEHVELCRRRIDVGGVLYVEALTREEHAASELVGADGVWFVRRFRTLDVAPWLWCWAHHVAD